MCGRFTQSQELDFLQDRFGFPASHINYRPRYNLAPGQEALVVLDEDGRQGVMLRWGLVPHWAKEPNTGYKMINARAEGLEKKPSFRGPLERSRCLVPADGFYEWTKGPGGKQPHRLVRKDRAVFAMAGLWDSWQDKEGGAQLKTFTIVTTGANSLVQPIHERMPVILAPEHEAAWLDHDLSDPQVLAKMLQPYPAKLMEAYPVSTRVNSPAREGPELIEPAARQGGLFDSKNKGDGK